MKQHNQALQQQRQQQGLDQRQGQPQQQQQQQEPKPYQPLSLIPGNLPRFTKKPNRLNLYMCSGQRWPIH